MKKLVLLLLASCASTPAPSYVDANGACINGAQMFTPGCEDPSSFVPGCYVSCNETDRCEGGLRCELVTIDPCADSDCDACGSQYKLCM
jgi:hypothetical protein